MSFLYVLATGGRPGSQVLHRPSSQKIRLRVVPASAEEDVWRVNLPFTEEGHSQDRWSRMINEVWESTGFPELSDIFTSSIEQKKQNSSLTTNISTSKSRHRASLSCLPNLPQHSMTSFLEQTGRHSRHLSIESLLSPRVNSFVNETPMTDTTWKSTMNDFWKNDHYVSKDDIEEVI